MPVWEEGVRPGGPRGLRDAGRPACPGQLLPGIDRRGARRHEPIDRRAGGARTGPARAASAGRRSLTCRRRPFTAAERDRPGILRDSSQHLSLASGRWTVHNGRAGQDRVNSTLTSRVRQGGRVGLNRAYQHIHLFKSPISWRSTVPLQQMVRQDLGLGPHC